MLVVFALDIKFLFFSLNLPFIMTLISRHFQIFHSSNRYQLFSRTIYSRDYELLNPPMLSIYNENVIYPCNIVPTQRTLFKLKVCLSSEPFPFCQETRFSLSQIRRQGRPTFV